MMGFYSSEEWLEYPAGHPGGKDALLWLLEKSGIPKGSHILDLCCGRGDDVGILLANGYSVTGADHSVRAIERAKACYREKPAVAFCTGDARKLPMNSHSADAVLCQCSLSLFTQDIPVVLKEIRRILRPGGSLLLSDVYLPDKSAAVRKPGGVDMEGSEWDWRKRLGDQGFLLVEWKDRTAALRPYCMEYLWKTGRPFPVCACGGGAGKKLEELGYFLGVWRCMDGY